MIYPEPRDILAWRDLFMKMPERVRNALYDNAPTGLPGDPAPIAWAVISYHSSKEEE